MGDHGQVRVATMHAPDLLIHEPDHVDARDLPSAGARHRNGKAQSQPDRDDHNSPFHLLHCTTIAATTREPNDD
jgi:hypothetical protein